MYVKFFAALLLLYNPALGAASNYVQLINDIKAGEYVKHIPDFQMIHNWNDEAKTLSYEDELNLQAYHFSNTKDFEKTLWGDGVVDLFTALVVTPHDHPASGWKIHVSASFNNATQIATIVGPFLCHHRIPSKIAGSLDFLESLKKDSTQKGKFITIYPRTYKQAKTIANQLNDLICEHELNLLDVPRLLCDAQIGDSGLVFIRYGKHIERKSTDKSVTFVGPFGKRYKDRKILDSRYFPFPEFVWKLNKKALGGDLRLFQGMTFKWVLPGTNHIITLNDGSVKSWHPVLDSDYEILYIDAYEATRKALH